MARTRWIGIHRQLYLDRIKLALGRTRFHKKANENASSLFIKLYKRWALSYAVAS